MNKMTEKFLEWVSEIETMNERLRKDVRDTTQEIEDLTESIRREIREGEGGITMRKIAGKWYPKGTEETGEDRVVEVSFDGDMMYINIINEGVLKVIDIDMVKTFAWSGKED